MKISVGFLGRVGKNGNPNNSFKIILPYALQYGIEFFYFQEEDIDNDAAEINGLFWNVKSRDYERRKTGFPDIVEVGTDVLVNDLRKPCYKPLLLNSVFTILTIFNDKENITRILNSANLGQYAIETFAFDNNTDILQLLQKYDRLILKPNAGQQAANIFKLSRQKQKLCLHDNKQEEILTPEEFTGKYKSKFSETKYLIQPFYDFTDSFGRPFITRVTIHRNGKGTWKLMTVIPIVSEKNKILANAMLFDGHAILQGVENFYRSEYGADEGNRIFSEIPTVCFEAADAIQKAHSQLICKIGFDIGIDKASRQLKIIEPNASPWVGPITVNVNAQTKVKYYSYLMKNKQRLLEQQKLFNI